MSGQETRDPDRTVPGEASSNLGPFGRRVEGDQLSLVGDRPVRAVSLVNGARNRDRRGASERPICLPGLYESRFSPGHTR